MPIRSKHKTFRRGDTMIEVLISFAIFAFVAMTVMSTMTRGVAQGQRTLEITMARNAMDMQTEAIRFWHEAASGTGGGTAVQDYTNNWNSLVDLSISREQYRTVRNAYGTAFDNGNCPEPAGNTGSLVFAGIDANIADRAFIVNSRNVRGTAAEPAIRNDIFTRNVAFPQLVYGAGANRNTWTDHNLVANSNRLREVQGIFTFVVEERQINPRFFDIHIHTCWRGSRLETTIRLTNPEL